MDCSRGEGLYGLVVKEKDYMDCRRGEGLYGLGVGEKNIF